MFDRFRFKGKRREQEEPETELPHETDRDCKRIKLEAPSDLEPVQTVAEGAALIAAARTAASLTPGKWQERWHGICDECFANGTKCTHHPEQRLRLLIVGHNPSDHAWTSTWALATSIFSMG